MTSRPPTDRPENMPGMPGIFSAACAALVCAAAAAAPPAAPAIVPATPAQVRLDGPFWGPRMEAVRGGTLDANRRQCEETGRLANFDRAAAALRGDAAPGEFQGLLFNDSDVYKMVEGWSTLVATEPDAARRAALQRDLDAVVARIVAAQRPDGYINTYYTLKAGLEHRLTKEASDHETYCIGHLIEAGVAHFEATGSRTLLDAAIRAAGYLRGVYGEGRFTAPPGHQELELALVKLARVTGDAKWLDFAAELLAYRGRPHRKLDGTMYGPWGDYAQDHLPVEQQREAAGHAVRAAYMYSAMADLAARGHPEFRPALESLWKDIVERRIFITGGIGPSGHNEGFTVPYDIPIQGAYQETCASIGLCLWAHRMFLLTGEAKYMEQFERTLYNAVLAGVSADGRDFFYVNPMVSQGKDRRQKWFACACCPPNVLRFLAGLGQYAYAVRGDTVFVNLYAQGTATLPVPQGSIRIEQRTGYPFDGGVHLEVTNDSPSPVTLALRAVPGLQGAQADGYARAAVPAKGTWSADWTIPLAPTRARTDPRVQASAGQAVLMRGPVVYAAEACDNGGSVEGLLLRDTDPVEVVTAADGVPALVAHAARATAAGTEPATITLRPYFLWCNRAPGGMRVWFPPQP
ncbi:MAG: glycoside hydrolase family 127 protein [Phycisphaerales bacterium]